MNINDILIDKNIVHEQLIPKLNEIFKKLTGAESNQTEIKTIDEVRTELINLINRTKIYDQAGFFKGKPQANEIIYYYVACRRVNIPENFSGSILKVIVAPTGNYTIKIFKNDLEVGSITISSGTKNGVFSSIGAFTLDVGDILIFKAQDTQDSTLETLIWNIKAEWSE